MEFKQKFSYYVDKVNKELSHMFPNSESYEKIIYDAMNYSLSAGGKRIRPVITAAFSEMLGGSEKDALYIGSAIECIHTYSLIHDDLPCMDNDELRRGKPTCHMVFGEANALLAGDGLLNFAFERLSDFSAYDKMSAEAVLKVVRYISLCSGTCGMIGGQVVDLAAENSENTTPELLSYIHKKKTAALIRCSAVAGVICGGGDERDIKAAEEYAEALGLAFQIKDDILDCCGDEKKLGKKTGSDEKSGKSTYVSFYGLKESEKMLEKYTEASSEALAEYGEKAEFLKELSKYLLKRDF